MENQPNIRKKVNSLTEIYDGKNLLVRDFSNLDLSNIDLSCIPSEKWKDCIFYNTSFKNTKINLKPLILKRVNGKIKLDYCDFSDNDLSYLNRSDFFDVETNGEISTYGCNFRNTKLNCLTRLINVELDISYQNFDKDYFGTDYAFFVNQKNFDIDINTLIKNPFLNVSSARVLWTIHKYLQDISVKSNNKGIYHYQEFLKYEVDQDEEVREYKRKIVKQGEELLKLDKDGHLIKFYQEISKNMILEQKFCFFNLAILNARLENMDFSEIPFGILSLFEWHNNHFINFTVGASMLDLLKMSLVNVIDYNSPNKYDGFKLPFINYSSWQDNGYAKKKVSSSSITFFNKVYLELSRTCNALCPFCRNATFEQSTYDFEKITNTLDMVKDYINAVVIGGGEPTLKLDDVKKLRRFITDSKIDWHMFTNGTNSSIIDDDYIMNNFKINLSRHAIEDKENAFIFGVQSDLIMTSKDIERLNLRNKEVTLNATCFNGGLDSLNKILAYIDFARSIGCKSVLIQDLQKSTSLGCKDINYDDLCLDPILFEQLISYLKRKYKMKHPIYATGGYVSYVFKDRDFSISIQKYITPNELETKWVSAVKRTFDLSIDPSGNLYENWNQVSGFVKKI